jgi:hypothetical protein
MESTLIAHPNAQPLGILGFPTELLLEVFKLVQGSNKSSCDLHYRDLPEKAEIQNLRLVCRRFQAIGADLLFKTIYVELTSASLDRLNTICFHPGLSKCVRVVRILAMTRHEKLEMFSALDPRISFNEQNLDVKKHASIEAVVYNAFYKAHSSALPGSTNYSSPGSLAWKYTRPYTSRKVDLKEDLTSGGLGRAIAIPLGKLPNLRLLEFNDTISFLQVGRPRDEDLLMSDYHAIYPQNRDRRVIVGYSCKSGAIKPATVAAKLMEFIRQEVDLTHVKVAHKLHRCFSRIASRL